MIVEHFQQFIVIIFIKLCIFIYVIIVQNYLYFTLILFAQHELVLRFEMSTSIFNDKKVRNEFTAILKICLFDESEMIWTHKQC